MVIVIALVIPESILLVSFLYSKRSDASCTGETYKEYKRKTEMPRKKDAALSFILPSFSREISPNMLSLFYKETLQVDQSFPTVPFFF